MHWQSGFLCLFTIYNPNNHSSKRINIECMLNKSVSMLHIRLRSDVLLHTGPHTYTAELADKLKYTKIFASYYRPQADTKSWAREYKHTKLATIIDESRINTGTSQMYRHARTNEWMNDENSCKIKRNLFNPHPTLLPATPLWI